MGTIISALPAFSVTKEFWEGKLIEFKKWRTNFSEDTQRKIMYSTIVKSTIPGNLLDIGCGKGLVKNLLPSTIKQYYGIDAMFYGSQENIVVAEAENLPFKTELFDNVLCIASIFHFRDLDATIKEMKRVLKPRGKIIISIVMEIKPAKSHTFLITHSMMEKLAENNGLNLYRRWEVKPEFWDTWVYEWTKR